MTTRAATTGASRDPRRPTAPDEIDFGDVEFLECPYEGYRLLQQEAPVWRDPRSGHYIVTRYDDVRAALLDVEHFPSSGRRAARSTVQKAELTLKLEEMFASRGWKKEPGLPGRDDPEHKNIRSMMDRVFRPSAVRELRPFITDLAESLLNDIGSKGRCEWVAEFAVPLPLFTIGRQMGARSEHLWQIKLWADAWMRQLGMLVSDDELIAAAESELDAQRYFQPIIERLRDEPDGTFLSDLVNTVIPGWGRPFTDAELHAEILGNMFVGGSETTANAFSAGMMLLAQNPEAWEQLKANPDREMATFVEEVIRLESPLRSLVRRVAADVELGGLRIPAGSVVDLRLGAANRDEDVYRNQACLDLDRDNARTHLAFGFGVHHCLGANLARAELSIGFTAVARRWDRIWLTAENDFRHLPNRVIRSLERLHVGFTPASV